MKTKEFLKTLKGKISIGVITILALITISQYPTSTKKVFEEYKEFYDVSVITKYYDGKGLFGSLERKRAEEVFDMATDEINRNIMALTGGDAEDLKNVKIDDVNIKRRSYSSEYLDIETTIKNNSSKDISYIKINLYFRDKNDNIIKSDWTNDSATIKPGSSQIITKMVRKGGWEVVQAEIDTVKFK